MTMTMITPGPGKLQEALPLPQQTRPYAVVRAQDQDPVAGQTFVSHRDVQLVQEPARWPSSDLHYTAPKLLGQSGFPKRMKLCVINVLSSVTQLAALPDYPYST